MPFIWGAYDGDDFRKFKTADDLISFYENQHVILYAHNGGKFDFMFLLRLIKKTRALIINSRIVEMKIGKATLRDSFAIVPMGLAGFQKTDIEYWKLEAECRAEHMPEIVEYLKSDCVNLYNLVMAYRSTAGTKPTIASNALSFAKKLGLNPGKTSHRFDTAFRRFYFGGRVECFAPGSHENVRPIDIKSSYPNAMRHEHPTGANYIYDDKLPETGIEQSFIKLQCHSKGAFPLVVNHTLTFPHGDGEFFVTGWEYVVAQKHGLISNVKIDFVCRLEKTMNFAAYVDHWYDHKATAEKAGDKAQRIVGKFMMNSLYGKLAQNPIHYYDYEIAEGGTAVNYNEGWELAGEFDTVEIHRRSVMWRYEKQWGDEWQKFPIHYNVATGASITGFARAHLLDAAATVGFENIAYCDTDCLHVLPGGKLDKLRMDDELGAWASEGHAKIAHYAGKKMYALELADGTTKIASKGAKLGLAEIKKLVKGEIVVWNNDAPTFSLARGTHFVTRSIRATTRKQNEVIEDG